MLDRAMKFMTMPRQNPELPRTRRAALSRMIPPLSFIVMANAWMLSTSFDKGPIWLGVHVSLLLGIICVVRDAVRRRDSRHLRARVT